MKNLVTESDFVETYDDFLSETICSELISLVDEENERIDGIASLFLFLALLSAMSTDSMSAI